jgi:4-hydroxy-tetrahydrodipicolinate synthase
VTGRLTARFAGVIAAPVTPFGPGDEIDLDTAGRLCDFLVRQGVDGVALPLHTGESLNLTSGERMALLEAAIKAVDGRVPVLAHVSLPGTDQVVELARHAESVGAAAVVAVTPYHWRPSPAGILGHFGAISDAVSVPLLAYNFPSRIGVAIDEALLERLIARCPNLVGVKDASYDMQSFTEACRVSATARPGFSLLTGVEYLLPAMVVGAAGCFSPASSIAPRLIRSLHDAVSAGDLDTARSRQWQASRLWHLLREAGYPASVKVALGLLGRPVGGPRLPLVGPGEEATRRLEEGLRALGLFETESQGWD